MKNAVLVYSTILAVSTLTKISFAYAGNSDSVPSVGSVSAVPTSLPADPAGSPAAPSITVDTGDSVPAASHLVSPPIAVATTSASEFNICGAVGEMRDFQAHTLVSVQGDSTSATFSYSTSENTGLTKLLKSSQEKRISICFKSSSRGEYISDFTVYLKPLQIGK